MPYPTRAQRRSNFGRGNALLEFALILPLLLTGIFGVIEFGRALYTFHFVSNAAREATRWASVRGQACDKSIYPQACPANSTDVENFVKSIAPAGIDKGATKLTVNSAWLIPPGKTNPCSKFQNNPGCAVQVQVIYQFKFVLPFLPTQSFPMQSTSQMIISQ